MKYFTILLFITLYSCNSNIDQKNEKFQDASKIISPYLTDLKETSNMTITIKIPANFDKSDPFFLSDIIDKVWYVKLETTKESLIRYIDKVIPYKNNFFILDVFGKSLLQFNSKGRFIRKIGSIGKGPGEYMNPISFIIDSGKEEILLHDDKLNKMIYYSLDGSFLNEKKLNYRFMEFEKLGTNKYIISIDRKINFHLNDVKNYKLILASSDWHILGRAFEYEAEKKNGIASAIQAITKYKDSLIYNPSFSYDIYSITQNGIDRKYSIDVGNKKLPDDFDRNLSIEDFIKKYNSANSDIMYIGKPFFETEDHLITTLNYKKRNIPMYYSKNSHKVICGLQYKDDMLEDFGIIYPIAINGNVLIGKVNASTIITCKEAYKKHSLQSRLSAEKRAFMESIKENDNPVLSFFTIKKF